MKINKTAQDLINQLMERHPQTKLTIGILHKGETSLKLFDQTGEIPYENHLYEMGSIGKTFTTSLFAKLVSEEKMSLTDSVAKYIPELDDGKYYPTLGRLATHTAGYLANYEGQEMKLVASLMWRYYVQKQQPLIQDIMKVNKEKLIRFAKKRKLVDQDYPWVYSNFGMALLGLAISNVIGTDFLTAMTNFINQELKLTETVVGSYYDQLLQGYDLKNQVIIPWDVTTVDQYIAAGAGMFSTATDLLKYAQMNLETVPTYLELTQQHHGKGAVNSGMDMALGWWLNADEKIWWHAGNTNGCATSLAFAKEKDFACVVLANVQSYAEREQLGNEILLANWDEVGVTDDVQH